MSTTTATPEQLAKLPKWAQEHIKTLETQRVQRLDRRIL